MNDSDESTVPISLLATFDDLQRNNQILLEASEEEFLQFVNGVTKWKERWENTELECQRLSIELTKQYQEVRNLERKLEHARGLLDDELAQRRRAEEERDRLADHLTLLRQLVLDDKLVDQVTLKKIQNLDKNLPRTYSNVLSPGLVREAEDMTVGSIHNVDDLSFDDTLGLVDESRTRSGAVYGHVEKRRSGKRSYEEPAPQLETVASPRGGVVKRRRSRSVGFREPVVEVDEYVPRVPQPLGNLDKQHRKSASVGDVVTGAPPGPATPSQENMDLMDTAVSAQHHMVQKTVLIHEICTVCGKRLKFGRICLKCRGCKTTTHTECAERVHPVCEGATVSYTPSGERGSPEMYRTPTSAVKKKQIFSSPMLR